MQDNISFPQKWVNGTFNQVAWSGAGSEGGLGSIGDGGLPETQLLALAQRQAERDRELAAAHRYGVSKQSRTDGVLTLIVSPTWP